jgi:hypothetical protein
MYADDEEDIFVNQMRLVAAGMSCFSLDAIAERDIIADEEMTDLDTLALLKACTKSW